MVINTPRGRIAVKSSPLAPAYGYQARYWGGPGLMQLSGKNLFASYATLYRTQPYLAAAVNKIARMIARLPIRTYEADATGQRTTVLDHPVPRVLAKPHPKLSTYMLVEAMLSDVALFGNSTTVIMQNSNGEPTELWPMPWPQVEVHGKAEPQAYSFHGNRGGPTLTFDADRVIHLRFWSPNQSVSPLIGTSPVEPLRRTLLNEDGATRWVSAMFNNAGRPSGAVSTDQKLTRDQMTLVREELETTYGGADNAFKIAILNAGLKWDPISFTAVDTEMVALRKLNREEVAAAYDIPPPMLQILDKATFSNVTEQHRNLYQDTLAPWIALVEGGFQTQLLASRYPDLRVEFDLNEVLQGAPSERAAFYQVARRWLSPNAIRAKENEPPIGDATDSANPYNMVWMPVNEFPISPDAPAAPPVAQAPAKALLDALTRAESYAASRVGAGLNGFNPDRFSRELLRDLGREDHACKQWTEAVGRAVGEAIHGADSAPELHDRMAQVRKFFEEPPEEPLDPKDAAELELLKATAEAKRAEADYWSRPVEAPKRSSRRVERDEKQNIVRIVEEVS